MKPLTKIPPLESRKCLCGCGKVFRCLPTSEHRYGSLACALRHTKGRYSWKVELDFKREWRVDKNRMPHYLPDTDGVSGF